MVLHESPALIVLKKINKKKCNVISHYHLNINILQPEPSICQVTEFPYSCGVCQYAVSAY